MMNKQLFGVTVATYNGTERYAVVAADKLSAWERMAELCDPVLEMEVIDVCPLLELIEEQYGDVVILTSEV